MTIFNKQVEKAGKKLQAEASTPSTITGEGVFFVKIVSGIAEGFYVDDQGQEVQITTNGALNAAGGGGAVDSVNGFTGTVVLTTADIAEDPANLYYTEVRVSANSNVAANTAKVSADGSIGTHSNVDLTGLAAGKILEYNGSNFVPIDTPGGGSSEDSTEYLITLPSGGSLATRIGAATIPSGWSLDTADSIADPQFGSDANDLVITWDAGLGTKAAIITYIQIDTAASALSGGQRVLQSSHSSQSSMYANSAGTRAFIDMNGIGVDNTKDAKILVKLI